MQLASCPEIGQTHLVYPLRLNETSFPEGNPGLVLGWGRDSPVIATVSDAVHLKAGLYPAKPELSQAIGWARGPTRGLHTFCAPTTYLSDRRVVGVVEPSGWENYSYQIACSYYVRYTGYEAMRILE